MSNGNDLTREIELSLLIDARLQLHWAAQVVGAVGLSLLEPVSDFSHTSLTWHEGAKALASKPVERDRTFRAALRVYDLTLLALVDDEAHELPLAGRTLASAYEWLSTRISAALGEASHRELKRFDHEMPEHPVGDGGDFSLASSEGFRELHDWYAAAFVVLNQIRTVHPHASGIRCWPHHFDVATLIRVEPTESGEAARSVGVGMSPGDRSYREPYWYVTPWPYPASDNLPEIDAGLWHTEGWVGAVLTRKSILEAQNVIAGPDTSAFLESAITACLEILDVD